MNPIGIMQGRLSPARQRMQSFPWDSWEAEFDRARDMSYDSIEWLFDGPDFERNPLWTEAGIVAIEARVKTTGVVVQSICANYFMAYPLLRVTPAEAQASGRRLVELIARAKRIGAGTILVPVLEDTEIRTPEERNQLLEQLQAPLQTAAAHGIQLALETELAAGEWQELMELCGQPALGVYYDVGNATAHGYDAALDLRALAPYLRGVHIKDRAVGGPNVPLGTGGVNFERVFAALVEVGYRGPLILETTVGDDYDHYARRHLDFVRSGLARAQAAAQLPVKLA